MRKPSNCMNVVYNLSDMRICISTTVYVRIIMVMFVWLLIYNNGMHFVHNTSSTGMDITTFFPLKVTDTLSCPRGLGPRPTPILTKQVCMQISGRDTGNVTIIACVLGVL